MKSLLVFVLCACGGSGAPKPTTPKPPTTSTSTATTTTAALTGGPVTPAELTGVVKQLRVQGVTTAQRTLIEVELAVAKDKPVDSEELRMALANVVRVDGVADVTVQAVQLADGVELVIEVTGHPVMKKLVVIEAGGKSIPLGIGAPTLDGALDPQRVQALAQKLRDRYVTNGYFDADVTWRSTPIAGGIEVTIEVVPGPISAIDAIAFAGNTVAKQDLEAAVAKWLAVGQPVVETRVTSAVEAISAYYWDKGYASVKVIEPEITAGRIALTFKIIEGPQFKMGKIGITGIPISDRATYLKLFGVKEGDLFSRSMIAAGRDKISAALITAGRPDALVLPLTKLDIAGKRIGLTLEITGGPP